MKISKNRLDIVYERPFLEPVFSVGKSASEILGGFYKALNPEFRLAMSDLTVSSANSMGDLCVRAILFKGNGLLEVSVDRFAARFTNLQSDDDVEVVKNVIRLSQGSLSKNLSDMMYKDTIIRTSAWIEYEGFFEEIKKTLAKYGAPKHGIDINKMGAESINHSIRGSMYNKADGWAINFGLEASELPGYHIYFLCNGAYVENGTYDEFDAISEHFAEIHRNLLSGYGLYPESND